MLSSTIVDEAFKPIVFGLDLGALLVLGCFVAYAALTLVVFWKAHEKGKRCGVYEGYSTGYQAGQSPEPEPEPEAEPSLEPLLEMDPEPAKTVRRTVKVRTSKKGEQTAVAPKRRGRPPGSKNKKKTPAKKASHKKRD